jgi:hypothetical protein
MDMSVRLFGQLQTDISEEADIVLGPSQPIIPVISRLIK